MITKREISSFVNLRKICGRLGRRTVTGRVVPGVDGGRHHGPVRAGGHGVGGGGAIVHGDVDVRAGGGGQAEDDQGEESGWVHGYSGWEARPAEHPNRAGQEAAEIDRILFHRIPAGQTERC